DSSVDDRLARLRRELEQAERVAHRDAALAHLVSDRFVGQAESIDELPVGERRLDRIEVLALDVLDERQLEARSRVSGVPQDGRYGLEPGDAGGPQPSLTGDQLVAAIGQGTDHDRLQDAVDRDRGRQLAELLFPECRARLVRIATDAIERDL